MKPKILISYFYQIRFFKPYMIPISTCFSDPKYFHQSKGKNFQFQDKNKVWNGIRAECFMPGEECEGLCHGPQGCAAQPGSCSFLQTYYNQLKKLDFNSILERFSKLGENVKAASEFEEEPIFVLIVYETPTNPCSERVMLKKWFSDNGYELQEYNKEDY